jgi:hypothetical protein
MCFAGVALDYERRYDLQAGNTWMSRPRFRVGIAFRIAE